MRYGIIGTGAIGGYYGAKLAHADQEVHFLLRSDYEYVKQHGLQMLIQNGIGVEEDVQKMFPNVQLDYDFHRRMEIYHLYTRPIEIAREAGCRMPKLEMLEAELRFLEEANIKNT